MWCSSLLQAKLAAESEKYLCSYPMHSCTYMSFGFLSGTLVALYTLPFCSIKYLSSPLLLSYITLLYLLFPSTLPFLQLTLLPFHIFVEQSFCPQNLFSYSLYRNSTSFVTFLLRFLLPVSFSSFC